jgi:VIT1/CCC1 family predicted Fe2+/Mn2+ transporter
VSAYPSIHVEPDGPLAIARHYIRDLVYGANDGIITTFAVVAGVAGGELSPAAAVIVGVANLAADGLSMGIGNIQAIRAHESARRAQQLPEEEAYPLKHGLATFAAFVVAGAVPLVPYMLSISPRFVFTLSSALTFLTLFGVGAARGLLTAESGWRAGFEMLALGVLVALAAYGAGALIAAVT